MIAIIDYGVGNVRSVQNMLTRAGAHSVITRDLGALQSATKLILPGVGHFKYAMDALRERGLVDVIRYLVVTKRTPLLGICLGAQLLGRHSEEGACDGLGLVPMDIVGFDRSRMDPAARVPHMGWAVTTPAGVSPLFRGMDAEPRFYYVHSYHFACDDPGIVMCTAEHGYRFASGFSSGHIAGVQFHPEKSHVYGQQLLTNFASSPPPG